METIEAWWVPFLGTLATLIAGALTLGINKLINYLIAKMNADENMKKAFDALAAGMAEAQNELVRKAKATAEDGKLTADEIKEVEAYAIERAKNIATGPAKEIIASWGKEQISSYIKQLLAKFNKGDAK